MKERSLSVRVPILAGASLYLVTVGLSGNQRNLSATELLERFKNTDVFWQQLEIVKEIVALRDIRVLPELTSLLIHRDRHLRGNVAFIFAGAMNRRS